MLIESRTFSQRPKRSNKRVIDDQTISQCFAGLCSAPRLLLAVSGGPDSMALLLMAAFWAQRLGSSGAPSIHVATIDHGLRPESRAEADMVAAASAELGYLHTTLTWTGPKPTTRLQEKARDVRYALLAAHAQAVGASHILTGHHADDQAETILLRLGRGSGISGLQGMRPVSALSGLTLVRPLLSLRKAELMAICRSEACDYVEDPSNRDPAFARSWLRGEASALAKLGLDTSGLLRFGRRMARAEEALETETDRIETLLGPERGIETYRVDLTRASVLAPEIAIRLVGRAVTHVAGSRAVRLERLERLSGVLWWALEEGAAYRATLAGTRVVLGRDRILTVSTEPPRHRGRGVPHPSVPSVLRPN